MEGFKYVPKQQQKKEFVKGFANLEKVISGGQTGADRAGLEAAQFLGIKTGGTAPHGWLTEDGPDLSLKKFGLEEGAGGYAQRTRKNVDDADATIAFRLHDSNGTDKTIGYARFKKWVPNEESSDSGYRPVLVITTLDEGKKSENVKSIRDFLVRNKVKIVNIAGHREKTAGISNFSKIVYGILIEAFKPETQQSKQ